MNSSDACAVVGYDVVGWDLVVTLDGGSRDMARFGVLYERWTMGEEKYAS